MDVGCPRCCGPVRPPGLFSSDWQCPVHGSVVPLHAPSVPSLRAVRAVAEHADVPLWLPWPLPTGWVVCGVGTAADGRAGAQAVAVAMSGPSLRGGPADVVLVAEQPGVGLGGYLSGVDSVDPGAEVLDRPPVTRVTAAGHEVPLWEVPTSPDRSVYVGEAAACWLWAVVWPAEAVLELHDHVRLVDLRDPGHRLDLPLGALSPRLPLATPQAGP